jgi:FlaA1/EpsC-like NDP-sugar epimerase
MTLLDLMRSLQAQDTPLFVGICVAAVLMLIGVLAYFRYLFRLCCRSAPRNNSAAGIVDFLVVGGGYAGLNVVAAIRRARPDATVLCIDKHEVAGGTQPSL